MFYKDDKLALFVDGINLHSTSKALGFDIDYKLLRDEFMRRGKLNSINYYTVLQESEDYSPIRPLTDWLDYNGFHVYTRLVREHTDAIHQKRKAKSAMNVDLAIHALELAPHVDHMVIFSGDGDFNNLIPALQRQGCRVTIISSVATTPVMVSDDLRRQANTFIDLKDLQSIIGRSEKT